MHVKIHNDRSEPVLPHKQKTVAGIKPHCSALCCFKEHTAHWKHWITFSAFHDLRWYDGGNLIRWYGSRVRPHSRSGKRVVISFYVINNQFEDVPHSMGALRISCSLTNLATRALSLLNHITTVPENWIAFLGSVPESESFFPPLWNLSKKSMVKYFAEPRRSWGLYCLYVGLQLGNQVMRWSGVFSNLFKKSP